MASAYPIVECTPPRSCIWLPSRGKARRCSLLHLSDALLFVPHESGSKYLTSASLPPRLRVECDCPSLVHFCEQLLLADADPLCAQTGHPRRTVALSDASEGRKWPRSGDSTLRCKAHTTAAESTLSCLRAPGPASPAAGGVRFPPAVRAVSFASGGLRPPSSSPRGAQARLRFIAPDSLCRWRIAASSLLPSALTRGARRCTPSGVCGPRSASLAVAACGRSPPLSSRSPSHAQACHSAHR